MLKPNKLSFLVVLLAALASGKVENSFQSGQYSAYNNYYSSTPTYPDLTVKSGDVSSSGSVGGVDQDALVGQGTAQQPQVHGTPNQHVYYYETYPMQDSSRGNAYNVPGNKRCTMLGNGNMRCYSRQDGFDYDTTGSDDSSGAGLGGLAGLIGLLGLKGIKGLTSVLFPIIFPLLFPLLIPFALPLLLPLLVLPLLLLLLIPIPVISIPQAGRALETGLSEARKMAGNVFEKVVLSEECIERLSCEIQKMSKRRKAGEWMEKAIRFLPEGSSITKRIAKGIAVVNANSTESKATQTACSRMKCKMLSVFD